MSSIKKFKHLKIPLQDIKSATDNFAEPNCIGRGGFGKVYKGQLTISNNLTTVAVKRLDKTLGQGATEFWKEIMLLSRYKHKNLVSLLGFCDEEHESILVYEYLRNKSLDLYLTSSILSWNQRLRICVGAAQGLQYLHEPFEGSQQRVLHRDIKSANILLDENWEAKIADFGLSKFGPANQEHTFLYSNAVGTIGYCDPLYAQTGFLTKESDIYSFGAVLFEVLCGRHCVQRYEDIRRFLPVLARKCYEEKTLDTIINASVKEQISSQCFESFSAIAYQCLRIEPKERPSVSELLKGLEIALQYQEEHEYPDYWDKKLPPDWEIVIRNLGIPHANSTTKSEIFSLLHKGILFDEGKKFFWINSDGKKCLLISSIEFLELDGKQHCWWLQHDYLRFKWVSKISYENWRDIACQINTSMLSLGTIYAANLVFKFFNSKKPNEDLDHKKLMMIKWKTKELSVLSVHSGGVLTPDNWYKIRMYHFINNGPNADFDIVIEKFSHCPDTNECDHLLIQGIEFEPLEMNEVVEELKGLSITHEKYIDDDDEFTEKKLPDDYERYIEMSDEPLKYTSKKELYLRLCEGFLCHDGKLWFSLCKSTGGICSMIPAKDSFAYERGYVYANLVTHSLAESRFGKVIEPESAIRLYFKCNLKSPMFSPQNMYACYLVFKLKDDYIHHYETKFLEAYYILGGNIEGNTLLHLGNTPLVNIPTIKANNDNGSQDSLHLPRIEGMLKGCLMSNLDDMISKTVKRKDGWMEVMLCKPLHHLKDYESLKISLQNPEAGGVNGLIVEGIEFRPYI